MTVLIAEQQIFFQAIEMICVFSKTKNPVLSILITRNIVLSNRRIWFSIFSFICIMDSDGKIKSVIEGKNFLWTFSLKWNVWQCDCDTVTVYFGAQCKGLLISAELVSERGRNRDIQGENGFKMTNLATAASICS